MFFFTLFTLEGLLGRRRHPSSFIHTGTCTQKAYDVGTLGSCFQVVCQGWVNQRGCFGLQGTEIGLYFLNQEATLLVTGSQLFLICPMDSAFLHVFQHSSRPDSYWSSWGWHGTPAHSWSEGKEELVLLCSLLKNKEVCFSKILDMAFWLHWPAVA